MSGQHKETAASAVEQQDSLTSETDNGDMKYNFLCHFKISNKRQIWGCISMYSLSWEHLFDHEPW